MVKNISVLTVSWKSPIILKSVCVFTLASVNLNMMLNYKPTQYHAGAEKGLKYGAVASFYSGVRFQVFSHWACYL